MRIQPQAMLSAAALACGLIAASPTAHAEGWDELPEQNVLLETVLLVDILDPANEVIEWEGAVGVTVRDPLGNVVARSSSSGGVDVYLPVANRPGVYSVELDDDQVGTWDLRVMKGATEATGRLHADAWYFNAGDYTPAVALTGSFYAIVDGGSSSNDGVVEYRFDGLAGFEFDVSVNRLGIPGSPRRSVDATTSTTAPEYPIYLSPPERASYNPLVPSVSDFGIRNASGVACNALVPGAGGSFEFNSGTTGTYEIICDFNDDGTFDAGAAGDRALLGEATAGLNSVAWDGLDNAGNAVATGDYDCAVRLLVGELHYVGFDIETAFEGMRAYEVDAQGNRTGLRLFWNDTGVAGSRLLSNGETGADVNPPGGLASGAYADAANPYSVNDASGNARAWGRFIETSVGNEALLDTYTYLRATTASTISLRLAGEADDSDNDSITDLVEICTFGTNPEQVDTDMDGLGDFEETDGGTTAVNTDGDALIDALDTDSDGDGIPDSVEAGDADLGTPPKNSDQDSTPDYRDTDSDGDTLPDALEGAADFDNDQIPNFLDLDSDDDGIADSVELDGDVDMDQQPNFLDPDSDGDSIPDAVEGVFDDNMNMVPNFLDPDSDGDGISDAIEAGPDGSNPVDTDMDTIPDYRDLDSDNDGVNDADEIGADPANPVDSDMDGIPDFRDATDDAPTNAANNASANSENNTNSANSDPGPSTNNGNPQTSDGGYDIEGGGCSSTGGDSGGPIHFLIGLGAFLVRRRTKKK